MSLTIPPALVGGLIVAPIVLVFILVLGLILRNKTGGLSAYL